MKGGDGAKGNPKLDFTCSSVLLLSRSSSAKRNMSDQTRPRKPNLSFTSSPPSPPTLFPTAVASSSKMVRRPFTKPTVVITLALLALFAFLSFLISPSSPSSSSLSAASCPLSSSSSSGFAKIYLYDLPSKFTYGVVRSYALARGSSVPDTDSDLRYPGNQHSAEWWLFSDLSRDPHLRRPDSPVRRVLDPDDADLFYVPFFSSLSLVANPIRPANVSADATTGGATAAAVYSDEGMQEELMEWLEGQEYWRRNNGRDHVIICQDPNALYKVIDRLKNAVLLVSDFGRLRSDQASLVKDVILPYSHRINPYDGDVGVEGRETLLFFMGNRYRKEV